jgi:hypothetical protein
MKKQFPNHIGGVVQVQHESRWGSVPEALLEDVNLKLDSRAVAAWLAIKPTGWQISVITLRQRLALKGKRMLGKEKWQRIARELESAGYLFRKVVHGDAGQWVWYITFNPIASVPTVAGFPGSGDAVSGRAAHGLPDDGKCGDKGKPSSGIPKPTQANQSDNIIDSTTTTTLGPNLSCRRNLDDRCVADLMKLSFEPAIQNLEPQLSKILFGKGVSDPSLAQDLIDELAGAIELGNRGERPKIGSPTAWLRKLILQNAKGEFDRVLCLVVQARRVRQKRELDQVKFELTIPAVNREICRVELAKIQAIVAPSAHRQAIDE